MATDQTIALPSPSTSPVRRRSWPRFWRRAALALCATVLVCLTIVYLRLLHTGTVRIQQSDFLVYYSAAHLVLRGSGAHMYDFSALKGVEVSIYHVPHLIRRQAVFLYPPFVALALAPFAGAHYSTSFLVWFGLNCALLALLLRALWRFLRLDRAGGALLVVAAVSFLPVFAALTQGQISIVLLAALTGVFLSIRAGHEVAAGALLAVVLIKPPYVIPFVVLLALQRRWPGLISFGVASTVLAVLPSAMLGAGINQNYFHVLLQASHWHTRTGGFSPQANQNLAGLCQLLLPASVATACQIGLSLLALAGVAYLAVRSTSPELPFAAATIAALLINPHVLVHDLSLLLLPACILVRVMKPGTRVVPALVTLGYLVGLIGVQTGDALRIQLPVVVMAAALVWATRAGGQPVRPAEGRDVTPRPAGAAG